MQKNGQNLYQKVWNKHAVATLDNGQTQLFIGTHILHEVTSPQAFAFLRELNLTVAHPERTFATCDHIIPTCKIARPLKDNLAEEMLDAIEKNTTSSKIKFFGYTENYGVIHIIMPEQGIIRPGMTVACGDSHTATHGAFGAIAFGIGSSQVRDVLATQTMGVSPLKVKRILVNGTRAKGVTAKDVILHIIGELGVNGGIGYAYEFDGDVIRGMSMEERMTVCNMAIEGGARVGYVNPDETTFEYLKGLEYSPKGAEWDKELAYWKSVASDSDATFDAESVFDVTNLKPTVSWGITPAMVIPIDGKVPTPSTELEKEAIEYMQMTPGADILGKKVDVVFIGSCTNGRIEDLRAAAAIVKGRKVSPTVRTLVVPGSTLVKKQAEAEGLDKIFIAAGFDWREPGCSMCLAMNEDRLKGDELSVSTSNRNFKGRQGSATGRTILASPITAAASALEGCVADPRKYM
ncbi:MAG: 3-isopropylmalate dehydratase large subunit [Deferribacteraceae bacterium]|jgi:3-isopropylmalate/(R)-2-methylmalate dehydratase large subunit|nr:3-isopropylmalate dehydratase large subunit [Deferribacteraceae bacterium]